MKNKKGTIILSIILAVQFIIPLGVWGYETYKNKELEEKGQEVKVLVDWANYDEQRVVFNIDVLEELLYSDDAYIVFQNDESGFSKPKSVNDVTNIDLYIDVNEMYSWYCQDWCFRYETEITRAQDEYDYFELYDRETERNNIYHGFCEGPETQAYAVFKIYKNRFKVVDVYIDGMPVDTVIEKYNNNEWDNSRYEYHDKEVEIYDYYDEYYDEELGEYVTEATAA